MSSFGLPIVSTGGSPELKQVGSDQTVAGANEWMIPVDDGQGGVVVSCVAGFEIWIARIADPTSPAAFAAPRWASLGIVDVSDIAHIYAHGYHWIVYADIPASGEDNTAIWLIQIDRSSLTVVGSPVLINDPYQRHLSTGPAPLLDPAVYTEFEKIVGNDSCLVKGSPKYITIVTGYGGRKPLFISVAVPRGGPVTLRSVVAKGADTFDVGGSAKWDLDPGAVTASPFRVRLVTSSMLAVNDDFEGAVNVVDFDPTFATSSGPGISLAALGTYNYAMGTLEHFNRGSIVDYQLLTCRRQNVNSWFAGADEGQIVRHWFTGAISYTQGIVEEVESGQGGNRPHTLRYASQDGVGYLITCWSFKEQSGDSASQKVRVDRLRWVR